MPEPTDMIRATIAERLISIGATDDDGPGLFEWHPCTDREACTTVMDPPSPCPCAGRPYLNDQVWTAITEAFESAGRLLPGGGQTLVEWGVRNANGWGAWAPNAPRRESAEYHAERLGRQLVRREVQQFADGSSYSGPWVAVDQEATDG